MSCITDVSLLRDTDPNPGEHAHSRNIETSNKRACKSTHSRTSENKLSKTAKPLFIGSIPIAASNLLNNLPAVTNLK
jgi:hypothetical protein